MDALGLHSSGLLWARCLTRNAIDAAQPSPSHRMSSQALPPELGAVVLLSPLAVVGQHHLPNTIARPPLHLFSTSQRSHRSHRSRSSHRSPLHINIPHLPHIPHILHPLHPPHTNVPHMPYPSHPSKPQPYPIQRSPDPRTALPLCTIPQATNRTPIIRLRQDLFAAHTFQIGTCSETPPVRVGSACLCLRLEPASLRPERRQSLMAEVTERSSAGQAYADS